MLFFNLLTFHQFTFLITIDKFSICGFGIAGDDAISLYNLSGTRTVRMIKISFLKMCIQTFFKPLANLTTGKILTFFNNRVISIDGAALRVLSSRQVSQRPCLMLRCLNLKLIVKTPLYTILNFPWVIHYICE